MANYTPEVDAAMQELKKDGDNDAAIKKNYRETAKALHPDRQNGKTAEEKAVAEEKFKALSAANALLQNDLEAQGQLRKFNDEKAAATGKKATYTPATPAPIHNPTPAATPEASSEAVVSYDPAIATAMVKYEPAPIDDAYQQRLAEALKKQFPESSEFGAYANSQANTDDSGYTHSFAKPGTSFTDCYNDKGQPCTAVRVDPTLYTVNGVVDEAKRLDVVAEAGARYKIAQAEAKYPNDKQKGLDELLAKANGPEPSFWDDSTNKAKLDELTVGHIKNLLNPTLAIDNGVSTPAIENGVSTPAIENSASTPAIENGAKPLEITNGHSSSPALDKIKNKLGPDQVEADANTIKNAPKAEAAPSASTPISTTPTPGNH